MRELIIQGEILRQIITVIIRFTTQNMNVYTVQDVMHDVQLATYWLNKAVLSGSVESESDITQETDDISPEEVADVELPTESQAQLDWILTELEKLCDLIKGMLHGIPMSDETTFYLTSGLQRLTEAGFNTRMTKIAYEGLKRLGRAD